jgi:hypothetical protein
MVRGSDSSLAMSAAKVVSRSRASSESVVGMNRDCSRPQVVAQPPANVPQP